MERAEGVEMLRFVEHGHAVQMVPVLDSGVAVDTPEDLARAGHLLDPAQPGGSRRSSGVDSTVNAGGAVQNPWLQLYE